VNASTGALTAVTGSPFGSGGSQTLGMVADPFERLFTVNGSGSPNTVSAFTIAPGGSNPGGLTAVTGSPFAASGFGNLGIAEDASGRFVYALNASEISEFNVNQSSGALTTIAGSPFVGPVGTAPEFSNASAIVNSPFGSTLFVTNAGSGTIALLAVGPTGALTNFNGSPASSAESFTPHLVAAAVDPSNRFVYLLDSAGKDVLAYDFSDSDTVSTSNFVAIGDGNAFPLDPSTNNPTSLAIEPTGHYLYVTSSGAPSSSGASGAVTAYSINQTTGVLTEVGSPVVVTIPIIGGTAGGGTLTGAAVDPSGQYLYAVANNEAGSPIVSVGFAFTINPATGALTLQTTTFQPGYGANAMTVTGSAQ
jgi:6-phosphogluconolactonase